MMAERRGPEDRKSRGQKTPPGASPPETGPGSKKGQSGKRRGRPAGSKNRRTIVREIAEELHVVHDDQGQRQRTTSELALLALREHVLKGDLRAFRKYRSLLDKMDGGDSDTGGGVLLLPKQCKSIEEWEKINAEAMEYQAELIRNAGKLRFPATSQTPGDAE